jgi:hypothetical protein
MGCFLYRISWVKMFSGNQRKRIAGMARAEMVFCWRSWFPFPGNKTFPSYLMGMKDRKNG